MASAAWKACTVRVWAADPAAEFVTTRYPSYPIGDSDREHGAGDMMYIRRPRTDILLPGQGARARTWPGRAWAPGPLSNPQQLRQK